MPPLPLPPRAVPSMNPPGRATAPCGTAASANCATVCAPQAQQLHAQIVAEVGATMAITADGPQGDGPLAILDYYLELMQHYAWETRTARDTPHGCAQQDASLWREAAGVVAAITPWNFPFQINIAKIAPALAAGCTRDPQGGARDPVDRDLYRAYRRRTNRPAARGAQRADLE